MCGIDVEKTKLNIKMLRIQNKLKIKDLEDYFGLSHQALGKWEQLSIGTLPSLDNLVGLADLYGVKLDDIIVRNGAEMEVA